MKPTINNFRTGKMRLISSFIPVACLFFLASCGNKAGQRQAADMPPPAYPVFKVIAQTSTIKTDYPATLQGEQNIEIRPKIDGYIEKIYVDEGAVVKKGQLLFRINAPQYQQDVNNAAAAISSAEADVSAAELQVKKVKPLVEQDIVSKYELESAEYTLQARKATLAQARANLANAKINLGYADVTSPVNGVVGTIPYRLGSLVSSTTTMPLTTVSSINNVFAYFSMNEKQLLDFSREYKGNTLEAKLKQLPAVTLILADGSEYPEKGRVETVAGLLNTETGSASFRAVFPNPVHLLRSGASAVIEIPVTINDAIIVPQRSTYELQGKRFVYLVNDSNKVISTEIEVMSVAAGQYFVVTGGLKPGNTVVYESTSSLQDSTVIKPDMQPENKVYNLK
ncbi:efflux RND transporter periplasmic adaptor subunit [Parafilimonas sp.]|uniref:efflux RND transporter periplasmic adaptor subunit n=1 Tax=Parafilimonas sp. TaxID=1969739 RepID=UPI003F7E44F5